MLQANKSPYESSKQQYFFKVLKNNEFQKWSEDVKRKTNHTYVNTKTAYSLFIENPWSPDPILEDEEIRSRVLGLYISESESESEVTNEVGGDEKASEDDGIISDSV